MAINILISKIICDRNLLIRLDKIRVVIVEKVISIFTNWPLKIIASKLIIKLHYILMHTHLLYNYILSEHTRF